MFQHSMRCRSSVHRHAWGWHERSVVGTDVCVCAWTRCTTSTKVKRFSLSPLIIVIEAYQRFTYRLCRHVWIGRFRGSSSAGMLLCTTRTASPEIAVTPSRPPTRKVESGRARSKQLRRRRARPVVHRTALHTPWQPNRSETSSGGGSAAFVPNAAACAALPVSPAHPRVRRHSTACSLSYTQPRSAAIQPSTRYSTSGHWSENAQYISFCRSLLDAKTSESQSSARTSGKTDAPALRRIADGPRRLARSR